MTDDSRQQSYPPTWLGWVARIASLVVLVGLLTVLVKEAFDTPKPIDFQINIRQNDIRKVNDGFAVPIDITNIGTQAAREVKFEVGTPGRISQIASPIIGPNETIQYVIIRDNVNDGIRVRLVSFEAP